MEYFKKWSAFWFVSQFWVVCLFFGVFMFHEQWLTCKHGVCILLGIGVGECGGGSCDVVRAGSA